MEQAIERSRKPAPRPTGRGAIAPTQVIAELEKHILVDGFKLVFDLEKSRGSRFVDAASQRVLIDLYSFYASQPVGFNHPYFQQPEVSNSRESHFIQAEANSFRWARPFSSTRRFAQSPTYHQDGSLRAPTLTMPGRGNQMMKSERYASAAQQL